MKNINRLLNKFIKLLNKHTLLLALLVSISFIIIAVGFGWYNNKVVLPTTNPIARYKAEPNNPLSFMSNWDGPNYISLSLHGYQSVKQTNFFPLYPLLIHLVHYMISSPLNSAILVSWLSLIGAVYFYIKILKHLFNIKKNVEAVTGLMFFILFPTAIFLAATYATSLLIFTGLASIYFALKKNYLASGIFGLIATVANANGGFALVLACLILYEEKEKLYKIAITFIIGILGLVGYSIYLTVRFSQPLAFILSQKNHGWLNHNYSELISKADFFNIFFILLLIIAIIYWWNKRRSLSIFSFLFLLIPIVGNQFGGFNRYVLEAYSIPLMAFDYLKAHKILYPIIFGIMGIIWAYFVFQYAGGYVGG
jgi:hypothetical protein